MFSPVAEEQGYAPQSCDKNQAVDQTAEYSGLAAEYPGNKIELKKTDESPVDGADYYQRQSCFVHFFKTSFLEYLFAKLRKRYI